MQEWILNEFDLLSPWQLLYQYAHINISLLHLRLEDINLRSLEISQQEEESLYQAQKKGHDTRLCFQQ